MKKTIFTLACLLLTPAIISAETTEASSETKYYKTTTINGLPLHEEITESDYETAPMDNPVVFGMEGSYAETSYKKLYLLVTNSLPDTYEVSVELDWKALPNVRSYDVIGIRLSNNAYIENNSIFGTQIYWKNSGENVITYSHNGTNTTHHDHGYGTSMNLVNDSDVIEFQLASHSIVRVTNSNDLFVNASYQHAVSNVTLAQSQNYSISANGLGGVFYFNNNVSVNYDMMPGAGVVMYR